MNPKQTIISVLLVSFTVISVKAMELGELIQSGNGCYGSAVITPVSSVRGRISLPIRASLNKKADLASFERKACNIRVPIKLAPNEKLQILDVAQSMRLTASPGTRVKNTLNLSLVGSRTKDQILDVKAEEKSISLVQVLRSEKSVVLAESKCGEEAIIAGNSNILVTGDGKAAVTTGSVHVTLKVVNCEE